MTSFEKSLVKTTIRKLIKDQIKKEGKKTLVQIKPIDHGTLAQSHTPIYKIHRYFARRPYSVFNELVQHYSDPADIILDPFCGGGVTLIEGLRLRRKVIGVDLNPLATFITEMEAVDVSLPKIQKIFETIKKKVQSTILEYYNTVCPKCKEKTPLYWMKWSYEYNCPNCKKNVVIKDLKKKGSGTYICKYCKKAFTPITAEKINEVPFEMEVRCKCGYVGSKTPNSNDLDTVNTVIHNFKKIVKKNKL